VAEEAEAGDVGAGASSDDTHGGGSAAIQGDHGVNGGAGVVGICVAVLDGGADDTGAKRLGEHQQITDGGAGVGEDAVGMDATGDSEAELGLGIINGVAADDGDAGRFADGVTAAEDVGEDRERQGITREAGEVEGGEGIGAHGVDVAEGVGGGDAAEVEGIVDDGGEEVGGHDQSHVSVDAVHGGIVTTDGPDEDVGIGGGWEGAQDLRKLARGELAASAGSVGEARQAWGAGFGFHGPDVLPGRAAPSNALCGGRGARRRELRGWDDPRARARRFRVLQE